MFCSKCGSKIEDNTAFCPYCGNKINDSKNSKDKEKQESSNENSTVGVLNEGNNVYNQNPNINLVTDVKQESYEDLNKKSLIFGILGFFFFPCAIIAICFGNSYKKKAQKTSAGFVLGIISCVLELIMAIIVALVIFLVMYNTNTTSGNSGDNSGLKDYYENGSNMNYQTVGNDDYGYLTVSKDWSFYSNSNESTLQYIYGNSSNILTLYAMKNSGYTVTQYADSIKSRIQSYGPDNITYEIVNVGSYKAVKQQAYLPSLSSYMTTWCFQDENGTLHYIAINADSSTEFQDIVTTYKLTR